MHGQNLGLQDLLIGTVHNWCLASDAKVTSDNPFLALRDLTSLVEHARIAVPVQQCKADLEIDHKRLGRWTLALFGRLGVEDCFSTDAPCSGRSQIQQKGPGGACQCGWRARESHVIEIIV
jgi:hypothetical protein